MLTRERGAANWPFIISFVLLLVFGWLWFDQKGDADKFRDQAAAAAKKEAAANDLVAAREKLLDDTAVVVGFRTKVVDIGGGQTRNWTNPEAIVGHLSENGEIEGPDKLKHPGLLNEMKANASVTIRQDIWRANAALPQTAVDLSKIPPEFKEQLKVVENARPKDAPMRPDDDDDAAAVSAYNSARDEYDKAVAKYMEELAKLVGMPAWPAYSKIIAGTSGWDPTDAKVVTISFYTKPSAPNLTLQDVLGVPGKIVHDMGEAFTINKKADTDIIEAGRGTIAQLEKQLTEQKDQLATEQTTHTADVGKLTGERDEANAKAEKAQIEKQTAEKALNTTKENLERDLKKKDQVINAYEQATRLNKEKRDLEIQRDDADGVILEASATLGTAYINLGARDKVFPGLRFNVSYIGRGGLRAYKGQVVVLKVLDDHYSQASILSQLVDEKPIGAGDMISNPFYDATKTVHVYIAGELKKYPKAVAAARLKAANVVVDEAINSQTDYVVIPDSVTAKPAAPAGGDAAAPAAAAGDKSEYDRIASMARDYGATLLTERMLEQFLEY